MSAADYARGLTDEQLELVLRDYESREEHCSGCPQCNNWRLVLREESERRGL